MKSVVLSALAMILVIGCKKEMTPDNPLLEVPHDPTLVDLKIPPGYPQMDIPADNPITEEGVFLGRKLFYDPILSGDRTMACADCHHAEGAFTDNLAVSKGIDDLAGRRSSMSLIDIGYATSGLFWDGRSQTLEDQALLPVEDPLELHALWPEVENRLRNHIEYPRLFRKAFGIESVEEIDRTLAVKAIAQFERTILSSGNAKFDKFQRGEVELSDEEFLGYVMFFDLSPDIKDAECGHCHNVPLFTINEYRNNGIEPLENLEDFPDKGLAEFSSNDLDIGKFRIPTLRNITLSAPYMHDGRFPTLEDVLAHYSSGGHFQVNKDPLLYPLRLTDIEKEAIIAFLNTLTDMETITNPAFADPN